MKIVRINIVFAVLNVVLLLVLTISWLSPTLESLATGNKLARRFNRVVFLIRRPFQVLVKREFPDDESYLFVDEQRELLLYWDVVTNECMDREARLQVGPDFSVTTRFELQGADMIVREWSVCKQETVFTDMNADGFFDLRMALDKGKVDVMVDGNWRQTLVEYGAEKHRRFSSDGRVYLFDFSVGKWTEQVSDIRHELRVTP